MSLTHASWWFINMLYLYQNITPNYDDGIHYYFDDFSKYKASLSNSLFNTLQPDNYRINTEVCKIGFNNVITALNAQSITYIIDERDSYYRCYYIRRYEIQSNMIIYHLEMDYWGSFIATCSLSDIWVKRCNRKLGTPIFDDSLTESNPTFEYMPISGGTFPSLDESSIKANEYIDHTYLMIILAITYNTFEQSGASVTETRLFGKLLQTETSLKEVMENYGGLFALVEGGGDNLATITGAWIVDACGTPGTSGIDYTGTSKTFKFKKDDGTITQSLLSMINIYNTFEREYVYNTSDPSYKYYFGTYNNNMEIKMYGNTQHRLRVRYVLSNDHINVIVCDGDKQEDITSAFAISLSSTNGELRESRLLVQQLQNGLRVLGGTANLLGSSSPQGAISSGTSLFSDILGTIDKVNFANNIGHVVKGGDGYSTFNNKANQTLGSFKNPIVMLKYNKLQNGSSHVRRFGANYNQMINDNLYDLLNKSFLVNNSTFTYLMANIDVEHAPIEACDTIKGIFAKGVRLEFIE